MTATDQSEIDAKVQKSLEGTRFACSALKMLSGGSVNWVYQAKLSKPLDDGTTEVMIKHGEKFMLTKPEFALTLIRCRMEAHLLKMLSGSPVMGTSNPANAPGITVRTPKYYDWDEENTNQILEFMPNGTTMKNYVLKHFDSISPNDPAPRQLGRSLGLWLRNFTEWSARHAAKLRPLVIVNEEGKNVRHWVNFLWLAESVKNYPEILGEAKDIFAEVEQAVAEEGRDDSKTQCIHSDFWPGNVLLPDVPIDEKSHVPVFVIDWEISHLGSPAIDFGQMIAEMYTIWLYKDNSASLRMMEEFIDAYGDISEAFAFRTAIQIGAHLTTVIPTMNWGSSEQNEEVVTIGRDIIVNAWKKDRTWFEKEDLACLFRRVV